MAYTHLKANYQNDVLNSSVNSNIKYVLTDNGDGTISLQDATAYTTLGDSFDASIINATNATLNLVGDDLSDARVKITALENTASALQETVSSLQSTISTLTSTLPTITNDSTHVYTIDVDATVPANGYTTSMVSSACTLYEKQTARCIVGFNTFNQTDGGANASFVFPYKMYVNQTEQTVNFTLRNMASTEARVTVRLFVLYTQTEA